MKKFKLIIAVLAVASTVFFIYIGLSSDNALVTHPKGIIAKKELDLIIVNTILMLIVIVPTFILTLVVAWKYRANRSKADYTPQNTHGKLIDLAFWIIPSVIVVIMAIITWKATHELDPYKPLYNEKEPLTIQVIALDWKWLFIYPDQGIATVNFVQFPEQTPIHLKLSADGSPMNSFWVPELSGQIYCMTGMVTPLYIIADAPGEYRGKAAEINGAGYAGMNFIAKSSTQSDFDTWVAEVKKSPHKLTLDVYNDLISPSQNHASTFYSEVENQLFDYAINKPMMPL